MAFEHARLYAASQPVLRRSLQLNEVYPAFAEAVKALLGYDRIGVVVPEGKRLVMALSVAEPPLASWYDVLRSVPSRRLVGRWTTRYMRRTR